MHAKSGPPAASELIVVEGKSAASSVAQACDKQSQRVYAVQGKPPNAEKTARARVLVNPACRGLFGAVGHPPDGMASGDQAHQYAAVLILTDPDPDGLHCRILILRLLAKYCPGLFAQAHVCYVQAPLYRVAQAGEVRYADDAAGMIQARSELAGDGARQVLVTRFRGIAQMSRDEISTLLLNPASPRRVELSLDGGARRS